MFPRKSLKTKQPLILRSLSYVAIDIQPATTAAAAAYDDRNHHDKPTDNDHDEEVSFLDGVDPKALSEIVSTKDLKSLVGQYGGVKRLVETWNWCQVWY